VAADDLGILPHLGVAVVIERWVLASWPGSSASPLIGCADHLPEEGTPMSSTTTADRLLEALDTSEAPVTFSSEPGGLDTTLAGRVQAIREGLDLGEGSCNPPWSSWAS
jgi:hypothetical protein